MDTPRVPGFEPFIPDQTALREFTLRAVLTGAVLGIVFGASSLYLVLKVGLTVSASIPVAVAWLSPNELRSFASSTVATALSVSNFLFWQWLDYFGPDAERHGACAKAFGIKRCKKFGDKTDGHDVCGAADFVKVHFVGAGAVYRRFGFGEHLPDGIGLFAGGS